MKKHTKVDRDRMIFTGEVVDAGRGGIFRVKVVMGNSETFVLATPGGKLQQNMIKILVGDMVRVEISSYDTTRGRIVERIRK